MLVIQGEEKREQSRFPGKPPPPSPPATNTQESLPGAGPPFAECRVSPKGQRWSGRRCRQCPAHLQAPSSLSLLHAPACHRDATRERPAPGSPQTAGGSAHPPLGRRPTSRNTVGVASGVEGETARSTSLRLLLLLGLNAREPLSEDGARNQHWRRFHFVYLNRGEIRWLPWSPHTEFLEGALSGPTLCTEIATYLGPHPWGEWPRPAARPREFPVASPWRAGGQRHTLGSAEHSPGLGGIHHRVPGRRSRATAVLAGRSRPVGVLGRLSLRCEPPPALGCYQGQ